ncbi:hypothetical protein [Winogradskyella sp.]|uniref:hypothetical protein n=1 Tax=Winogradskyella sp. TaxID=1883156 RepID=UPI0026185EB6|nr:hypothetical protein [Winogradskyella sp.]
MDFIKIDRTTSSEQKIPLFDDDLLDLDLFGYFTITSESGSSRTIIEKLKIKVENDSLNKDHFLKSAFICDRPLINNDSFYTIVINLKKITPPPKPTPSQPEIDVIKNRILMDSSTLIYSYINIYSNDNEEITNCSDIDFFETGPYPEHKKGNILVGNP